MTESLIQYDPEEVLKTSRKILIERGLVPSNCPSIECLGFDKAVLWDNTIEVRLNAKPPQLPTDKEGLLYEIYPICRQCEIFGNPNRYLEVRQDLQTSRLKTDAGWKRGW
jgi:hypothetical protein